MRIALQAAIIMSNILFGASADEIYVLELCQIALRVSRAEKSKCQQANQKVAMES